MPRLVHSNGFHYAQYFPVDLMDLLFNQEKKNLQRHLSRSRDILSFTNQYIL